MAAPFLVIGLLTQPSVSLAADKVTFGTPTARATFGREVSFEQPVELTSPASRVELLLTVPSSLGPSVSEVRAPDGTGPATLRYSLNTQADHVTPNTAFRARWRVTLSDGSVQLGPETGLTYTDTRFDWKTLSGAVVRLHWYSGGDDFGRRALQIGEKAVEQASSLFGVTETVPIDFFVYAERDAFYDALGPGTRENVGGQANADIRTMFALISPGDIDESWVSSVVPHELTHLVFDTAVRNPYHFPPRWLNEGLAVYLSDGYSPSWRAAVESAVRDRTVIPLRGLTGQFPTTRDQFFLAYSESVSAVDFLVRTYGKPALVELVTSYAAGITDDEAFSRALGVDTAAFETAWLSALEAVEPTEFGPQPAPPGPLPSGWTKATATAAPGSIGATTPRPGASVLGPSTSDTPSASPGVGQGASTSAGPGGTPSSSADDAGGGGLALIAGAMVALVVGLALAGIIARRRRTTGRADQPGIPPGLAPPAP